MGQIELRRVEVRLLVSRPRPDLPEPTAELRACEGDYRSGETVWIRRVPGRGDRTYGDPLNGAAFVSLALLAGGAASAVAAGVWEERRSRKRREQAAADPMIKP